MPRGEESPTRLGLRVPEEAAGALGVSATFFEEHVAPDLKIVRVGKGQRRIRIVAVAELERWLDENGSCVAGEW